MANSGNDLVFLKWQQECRVRALAEGLGCSYATAAIRIRDHKEDVPVRRDIQEGLKAHHAESKNAAHAAALAVDARKAEIRARNAAHAAALAVDLRKAEIRARLEAQQKEDDDNE